MSEHDETNIRCKLGACRHLPKALTQKPIVLSREQFVKVIDDIGDDAIKKDYPQDIERVLAHDAAFRAEQQVLGETLKSLEVEVARHRRTIERTPSAEPLTREQVEDIGIAMRESNYPWKHQVTYILETDAALRATIEQQARTIAKQALELGKVKECWAEALAFADQQLKKVKEAKQTITRLEEEAEGHRAVTEQLGLQLAAMRSERDKLATSNTWMREKFTAMRLAVGGEDDTMEEAIERAKTLAEQLAAMTRERDAYKAEMILTAAHQGIDNYQRMLDQLATAQARVKELENERGLYERMVGVLRDISQCGHCEICQEFSQRLLTQLEAHRKEGGE